MTRFSLVKCKVLIPLNNAHKHRLTVVAKVAYT